MSVKDNGRESGFEGLIYRAHMSYALNSIKGVL